MSKVSSSVLARSHGSTIELGSTLAPGDLERLSGIINGDIPKGRNSLLYTSSQLSEVADYVSLRYDNAVKVSEYERGLAIQESKQYAIDALARVAYQISVLAQNTTEMFDMQLKQLESLGGSINYLNTCVQIHKEKVYRRGVGKMCTKKNNRPHRRVTLSSDFSRPEWNFKRKVLDKTTLDHVGYGCLRQALVQGKPIATTPMEETVPLKTTISQPEIVTKPPRRTWGSFRKSRRASSSAKLEVGSLQPGPVAGPQTYISSAKKDYVMYKPTASRPPPQTTLNEEGDEEVRSIGSLACPTSPGTLTWPTSPGWMSASPHRAGSPLAVSSPLKPFVTPRSPDYAAISGLNSPKSTVVSAAPMMSTASVTSNTSIGSASSNTSDNARRTQYTRFQVNGPRDHPSHRRFSEQSDGGTAPSSTSSDTCSQPGTSDLSRPHHPVAGDDPPSAPGIASRGSSSCDPFGNVHPTTNASRSSHNYVPYQINHSTQSPATQRASDTVKGLERSGSRLSNASRASLPTLPLTLSLDKTTTSKQPSPSTPVSSPSRHGSIDIGEKPATDEPIYSNSNVQKKKKKGLLRRMSISRSQRAADSNIVEEQMPNLPPSDLSLTNYCDLPPPHSTLNNPSSVALLDSSSLELPPPPPPPDDSSPQTAAGTKVSFDALPPPPPPIVEDDLPSAGNAESDGWKRPRRHGYEDFELHVDKFSGGKQEEAIDPTIDKLTRRLSMSGATRPQSRRRPSVHDIYASIATRTLTQTEADFRGEVGNTEATSEGTNTPSGLHPEGRMVSKQLVDAECSPYARICPGNLTTSWASDNAQHQSQNIDTAAQTTDNLGSKKEKQVKSGMRLRRSKTFRM